MTAPAAGRARLPRPQRPGPLRRLPLRMRVMVAFGLVSIVVTGLLSILAFRLAGSYMVHQRERSAVAQTMLNARLVEHAVAGDDGDLHALLTGLSSDVESATLVIIGDQVISGSNVVDAKELPHSFLAAVEGGSAVRQRLILGGVPVLAVGVPMPAGEGSTQASTFIQVSPIRELDRTLRYISTMLAIGVLLSGVAGALLGWWASARALRPLARLTAAAAAAAGGDLSTRLPEDDPDLAPLAVAFNETAERLQTRVRRDARFAGDVSHELRSPLMTMANAVAILERRRDDLSPGSARALDLLRTDVARFQQMVEDLLEISRSCEETPEEDFEDIDLGELVARTAAGLQLQAPLIRPDGELLVSADRRRLERAVVNLIENARRHGGGVVLLTVRADEGRARVEVDDAGPGVAPADREAIFERFARAAPQGEPTDRSGSGLGLALVAEHVRRHEGRAWVEERPGGGARFIIELPRLIELPRMIEAAR